MDQTDAEPSSTEPPVAGAPHAAETEDKHPAHVLLEEGGEHIEKALAATPAANNGLRAWWEKVKEWFDSLEQKIE